MKKTILTMIKTIFLLQAILLTQSCEKMTCKDDPLTINRTDNNSNELRLDGYYYGDLTGLNPEKPNIYLLYQNGIFYNCNSIEIEDVPKAFETFTNSEFRQKYKTGWGVYKIENNNIEIEYWVSRHCGGVGLLYEKGVIMNDTTFKITYWRHSVNGKTEQEKNIEAIFKFQEYSPKPDSTNSFIE